MTHETFADDTLRMMFVCFHPELAAEAQTALALRTLCGFSPAEIAAAFLTSEAAIAKRLVRARQRIRELALPFAVPDTDRAFVRGSMACCTRSTCFSTKATKPPAGDRLVREELCHEAIRLVTLVTQHPATQEPRASCPARAHAAQRRPLVRPHRRRRAISCACTSRIAPRGIKR